MPAIPKPKKTRTKHYFKEWREYRGLTQERAAERMGWSGHWKLSRIEGGKTPYSQDDLEAAAAAYDCSPTDLISVDPSKEREVIDLMALLHGASTAQKRLAYEIVKDVMQAATGTYGTVSPLSLQDSGNLDTDRDLSNTTSVRNHTTRGNKGRTSK